MEQQLFIEIKNGYTDHLVDIMTPLIFEGLQSIYESAVVETKTRNKTDRVLMVFQDLLQDINGWNQEKIEKETTRIKYSSNALDYFDDLVRAVVKCNIILYSYSDTISSTVLETFYNNFQTSTFIHRCYSECGKEAHTLPYLFYHEAEPIEIKRNHVMMTMKIKEGIHRAARKVLPFQILLKEFLINTVNLFPRPKVSSIKQASDIRNDREVMKLIQSEQAKTEGEKIVEMIQLDKILASIRPENNSLDKQVLNINVASLRPPITPVDPMILEEFGMRSLHTPRKPY